jgi:hypothetical protein
LAIQTCNPLEISHFGSAIASSKTHNEADHAN